MEDTSPPKITLSAWPKQLQMPLPAMAPRAESTPVSALQPFSQMTTCFYSYTPYLKPSGHLTGHEIKPLSFHIGTSKFNLWMKFPKSILIAVTLDLGDSELMMICEKHSYKLLSREFTLKVSLPFRSHWIFTNILPLVQVKLKWGQCISLYLDDFLKCLFL